MRTAYGAFSAKAAMAAAEWITGLADWPAAKASTPLANFAGMKDEDQRRSRTRRL